MANKRIALFQGSFDPFTRGHESIVMRALSIFDEVVIAKEVGACCLLRGVRNTIDFEYEKGNAEVNLRLSGIETVLVYTSPATSHISSTIVRELLKFDKEIKDYMPEHLSTEMLEKVKTFKP